MKIGKREWNRSMEPQQSLKSVLGLGYTLGVVMGLPPMKEGVRKSVGSCGR